VILVSSIGFVGYFLSKRFGPRLGLWLSGLLGGIVSSTAVTIASGRTAQKHPEIAGSALQGSILAASVMYIRILVLVWVLNAALVPVLWWRLLLLSAIGMVLSLTVRSRRATPEESAEGQLQNPFELRPAIVFAALFVLLSIATVLLKRAIGDSGILLLSAVVGVVDVDPFILSLIQSTDGGLQLVVSGVVIALMSNTIAKGFYFALLAPAARKDTAWRYALWAALHLPLILI
jgi:uncharacterized membrane protein (DUF4010 family)